MRQNRTHKRLYSGLLAICMMAGMLLLNVPVSHAAPPGPILIDHLTPTNLNQAVLESSEVTVGPDTYYSFVIDPNSGGLGTHVTINIVEDLVLEHEIVFSFDPTLYVDNVGLHINGNGHTIQPESGKSIRLMSITINNPFQPGNPDKPGEILPTITSLTFKGGKASGDGGALNYNGTYLNIDNCLFEDNEASGSGGAIYAEGIQKIDGRTRFIGNTAYNGGALYINAFCAGGAQNMGETEFYNNTATNNSASGGAIYIASTAASAKITFTNPCYFDGNLPVGNVPPGNAGYGIFSTNPDTGQAPPNDKRLNDIQFVNSGVKPSQGNSGAAESQPLKLPAEFTVRALSWLGYVPMYTAPDTGSAAAFRLGYYYTVTVIEYVDGFLLCEYTAPNGRVYKGYVEPRYLGRTSGLTW